VQVSGDPGLLERLVINLVQNALAHAQETVRVSVSRGEDGQAVLTVDDDGPGVPEDRRDDIFDRFVRLDPSRERGLGGVGLGLAIVAEIVHAHGGTVEVSDAPGGGARFVVELPGSQPELVGTAEHPGR
jgi:signal transduction histidine kinase